MTQEKNPIRCCTPIKTRFFSLFFFFLSFLLLFLKRFHPFSYRRMEMSTLSYTMTIRRYMYILSCSLWLLFIPVFCCCCCCHGSSPPPSSSWCCYCLRGRQQTALTDWIELKIPWNAASELHRIESTWEAKATSTSIPVNGKVCVENWNWK